MSATVVGSMVGDGVFSLPRWFAEEAGILGAMIAWLVAGSGMLMMAFVFQMLAMRTLSSTPAAYAGASFDAYLGSFSTFGYRLGAFGGNVTYGPHLRWLDHPLGETNE